ncbi:MAG: hypothetical protein LUD22_00070 [Coprobacillus sp.]|nr:hypothetical protein [Coprobacillus sp.]
MKNSCLLKSFILFTFILSFSSCASLPKKEEFSVVSTDSEEVLEELIKRGSNTSSWNGIYYLNNIDDSIGNDNDGYTTYEHILERTIASDLEGLITCINDIVIYIEGYNLDYWSEWEYYDGYTLYGNYFGQFEKEDINLSLDYIMSYPLLVLEASIEKFTIYSGLVSLLESILDVSFSGYIETSNLGNTNICIRIDENYIEVDGEDIIYGKDYAENIISYNEDNEIIEINYKAGDLYTYTDSDYFIKSEQILTIKEYNEKVDPPEWVNDYI